MADMQRPGRALVTPADSSDPYSVNTAAPTPARSETRPFVFLLNAMENAAQSENPYEAGYPAARQAVIAYVEKIERENEGYRFAIDTLKKLTDAAATALEF